MAPSPDDVAASSGIVPEIARDPSTADSKLSAGFVRTGLTLTMASMAILLATAIPFVRTYRGAPYVASAQAARRAVRGHCRELVAKHRESTSSAGSVSGARQSELHVTSDAAAKQRLCMVDLGSGSGELVFDAASLGMASRGVERNPVLVGWCMWRKWKGGIANVQFQWKDMWERGTVRPTDDVVVVFAVPGIMDRLGKKLESEMGEHAWLLSNTFEVPGWKKVRTSGGVHFYKKKS